jgi:hypothetical protein
MTAAITQMTAESAYLADLQIDPPHIPLMPVYLKLGFTPEGHTLDVRADIDRLQLADRFAKIRVRYTALAPEAVRAIEHFARKRAGAAAGD